MTIKVLSTFNLDDRMQQTIRQILKPVGGELVLVTNDGTTEGRASKAEQITTEIKDAEVMLVSWKISREQFKVAQKLKWISVPYAGVNFLLEEPTIVESEVTITNSSGVMAPAMADQIMGYIISFSRSLPRQWKAQQERQWLRDIPAIELAGRTLGIIGYGKVGWEVARRAKAFGMRIVATKTRPEGDYPELDTVWSDSGLDQLLDQSDFVLLAAPLTPQTRGMIGREQLAKMKPSAVLMNVGRGPLIKEGELIEALQNGQLAGAALDVFEREPLPPESPLWGFENVMITPHSTGPFDGFHQRTVEYFCRNLQHYVNGEPLFNVVDKRRGY